MNLKYLTIVFDDGPREPMCEIVDKFEKYGFKAGFAIYGANINDNSEYMLRYAAERGFQLVSHSQTHPRLETLATRQEIFDELKAPIDEVQKRIGYTMTMARLPHISFNDTVLDVARELNLPLLGHGMKCGSDWLDTSTPELIITETLETAADGVVACMHVKPNTCTALDTILPELKKRGFMLVTPDELFKIKGIKNIPLGINIHNANDIQH